MLPGPPRDRGGVGACGVIQPRAETSELLQQPKRQPERRHPIRTRANARLIKQAVGLQLTLAVAGPPRQQQPRMQRS